MIRKIISFNRDVVETSFYRDVVFTETSFNRDVVFTETSFNRDVALQTSRRLFKTSESWSLLPDIVTMSGLVERRHDLIITSSRRLRDFCTRLIFAWWGRCLLFSSESFSFLAIDADHYLLLCFLFSNAPSKTLSKLEQCVWMSSTL